MLKLQTNLGHNWQEDMALALLNRRLTAVIKQIKTKVAPYSGQLSQQ